MTWRHNNENEVVHETRLLRLGSQECVQDLERRPAASIREVHVARVKLSPKDAGAGVNVSTL